MNNIEQLTIKDFLSKDKYIIPIYQRNYDWGEKEALQLVEDISDYAKNYTDKYYYIGSAVVFPKSVNGDLIFEVIDGQQRLTTLNILAKYLQSTNEADWYHTPNICYDHRREADEALRTLGSERLLEHPAAQNIVDVYGIFQKNVQQILNTKGIDEHTFAEYLFNKVIIIRIPVPEDTELNHYFEIMNTRGEQLEKHEVLKAVLMSHLHKTEHALFDTIWDACSDMTSYVQMNFTINHRNVIFTEQWDALQFDNFDKLNEQLPKEEHSQKTIAEENSNDSPHSIEELINNAHTKRYELPQNGVQNDGEKERFESVINFPNFLLHVLKIMYHNMEGNRSDVDEAITLDDKRLIQVFDVVIKSLEGNAAKQTFVKQFVMKLLILRMKFDRYIIKREYVNGIENWSLKNLKKYDRNKVSYINTFSDANDDENVNGKHIRMLEAMFHVSAPTQIYKHWLNAVLYEVYSNSSITPEKLRERLYLLATTYMKDVYLTSNKVKFEDIIYKNDFCAQNKTIEWNLLDNGCGVPNFIFNFYDFVTWAQEPQKYSKFEFTYRTSVEHFYPQHPMPGYENLKGNGLDDFGNLCLISRGMNSKFSNNMPKAKLENFGKIDEVKNGLSLKLLEMMDVVGEKGEWGSNEIAEFDNYAKEKLEKALSY